MNESILGAGSEALADPTTVGMATEALRALINAILVFPGERRGEVSVTLRGHLAAFLRADAAAALSAPGNKKPLCVCRTALDGR